MAHIFDTSAPESATIPKAHSRTKPAIPYTRLSMLILVCALGQTTVSRAAETGLCTPQEHVAFSCATKRGIVSLCESHRQLHYRFGKPGKIEMSYPTDTDKTPSPFHADTLMYSGGGGAYVTFVKNKFRYTVFTAIGRWARNLEHAGAQGVAVAEGDHEVENLSCTNHFVSNIGPDLFLKDNLQPETPPYEFEIPEYFTSHFQ